MSLCVAVLETQSFAMQHGLDFIETSAKDNTNVDAAFRRTADNILGKVKRGIIDITTDVSPSCHFLVFFFCAFHLTGLSYFRTLFPSERMTA